MKYSFNDLIGVLERLRGENGCPWDKEQTQESLLPYLLEESTEFIEAVHQGSTKDACEELGDVLLQVVFHAQIAKEKGDYTIDDVVHGIAEKMVRRHPHVFDEVKVDSTAEVDDLWQEIKAKERAGQPKPKSILDKAKESLPALMRAQELQKLAAKTGFDWPQAQDVLEKVQEEAQELAAEIAKQDVGAENTAAVEEELGDLLFVLVNLAKHAKVDAQMAMLRANAKFVRRFKAMEALVKADGQVLEELKLSAMDEYWDKVKYSEKKSK
ncbi:MAG: nucleoside triphosphate pyrophosphohydrolase [Fibrobacter sp.]|nr:nucleoside triphosphate pyrophosphohydrolase [Fibrobacter sp.]